MPNPTSNETESSRLRDRSSGSAGHDSWLGFGLGGVLVRCVIAGLLWGLAQDDDAVGYILGPYCFAISLLFFTRSGAIRSSFIATFCLVGSPLVVYGLGHEGLSVLGVSLAWGGANGLAAAVVSGFVSWLAGRVPVARWLGLLQDPDLRRIPRVAKTARFAAIALPLCAVLSFLVAEFVMDRSGQGFIQTMEANNRAAKYAGASFLLSFVISWGSLVALYVVTARALKNDAS